MSARYAVGLFVREKRYGWKGTITAIHEPGSRNNFYGIARVYRLSFPGLGGSHGRSEEELEPLEDQVNPPTGVPQKGRVVYPERAAEAIQTQYDALLEGLRAYVAEVRTGENVRRPGWKIADDLEERFLKEK